MIELWFFSPAEIILSDFLSSLFLSSFLSVFNHSFILFLLFPPPSFSVFVFVLWWHTEQSISVVSVCQEKRVIKSINGYYFLVFTDHLGEFVYSESSFRIRTLISLETSPLNIKSINSNVKLYAHKGNKEWWAYTNLKRRIWHGDLKFYR